MPGIARRNRLNRQQIVQRQGRNQNISRCLPSIATSLRYCGTHRLWDSLRKLGNVAMHTIPAGPAPELVINAPRLVALSADHVQSSRLCTAHQTTAVRPCYGEAGNHGPPAGSSTISQLSRQAQNPPQGAAHKAGSLSSTPPRHAAANCRDCSSVRGAVGSSPTTCRLSWTVTALYSASI